jgi:MFS transporter, BCD family, chlorophyll transporter
VFETSFAAGLAVSIFAYALIGLGVGASGTSLLALLATATAPRRRAAAATITWLMMIFGIAVTSEPSGCCSNPTPHARLMEIVASVAVGALILTTFAIWGIERRVTVPPEPDRDPLPRRLAEIWAEPRARMFTLFVFLSMTAYFMQELILEPYAGLVFGYSPRASPPASSGRAERRRVPRDAGSSASPPPASASARCGRGSWRAASARPPRSAP